MHDILLLGAGQIGEAVAALPENFLERGLRLASRHLPLLLLIAAYLLMRILVAWWQGRA